MPPVLEEDPRAGQWPRKTQTPGTLSHDEKQRVLYFGTLSEPTAKTLKHLSQFSFFDARKLDAGIEFVDLGVILRTRGLEAASNLIMEQVKKAKPAIVVVDSFKAFDDLARSQEELRKFGYELAVNLMAWEVDEATDTGAVRKRRKNSRCGQ